MKARKKYSVWACFALCFPLFNVSAQEKSSLKDTLDGNLDASNYLVNVHGFIPVVSIITEPALGNFGLVAAPVFISPQKNKENKDRFRFPDITAGIGAYTLNNSWFAGAFRMGSIPKWGMRYTAGLGLGNINMGFYREVPVIGEKDFELNIGAKLIFLEATKNIYKNRVFLGLNYLFAQTDFTTNSEPLPIQIFDAEEMSTQNGMVGLIADLDYRNSMFTADKGIRFKTSYKMSRKYIGSDFDFNRVEAFTNIYLHPVAFLTSGWKAEFQGIGSGAPFYAYPFLIMRGIPLMRYQGKQTLLFETEQRFDLNGRWSLVGFAGTGRTFSDSKVEQNESWHWSGGVGFRYLLARVFKLRMGLDIAKGPDQYAYYIVFGHYWNR